MSALGTSWNSTLPAPCRDIFFGGKCHRGSTPAAWAFLAKCSRKGSFTMHVGCQVRRRPSLTLTWRLRSKRSQRRPRPTVSTLVSVVRRCDCGTTFQVQSRCLAMSSVDQTTMVQFGSNVFSPIPMLGTLRPRMGQTVSQMPMSRNGTGAASAFEEECAVMEWTTDGNWGGLQKKRGPRTTTSSADGSVLHGLRVWLLPHVQVDGVLADPNENTRTEVKRPRSFLHHSDVVSDAVPSLLQWKDFACKTCNMDDGRDSAFGPTSQ